MITGAETFEEAVLSRWAAVDPAEWASAEGLTVTPEPSIRQKALLQPDEPDALPLAMPSTVAGWSAVARIPSDVRTLPWMHIEVDGSDPIRAGIVRADTESCVDVALNVSASGLECFLDGFGDGLGPPRVEAALPEAVLLDDPISRLVAYEVESATIDNGPATVDGRYFAHHASAVAELTGMIAVLAEYLIRGAVQDDIRILIPCDHRLFTGVAKIRAARFLSHRVAAAFRGSRPRIELWGLAGARCTCPDRPTHQIRLAAAAVGAVLGTCDRIVAEPYTAGAHSDDDSFRLAANVLRLLRYESYLGVVQDPLAGAYYVEALTKNIVARCWEAFLEIEDAGGIQAAARSSALGSILEKQTRPAESDG